MRFVTLLQMKIGQRIAELRQARGWSQAFLASKAGVTASAINQIESGLTKQPKIETLFPIADALGVDPRELAGLEPKAGDMSVAIAQVLRQLPADRQREIGRYTSFQAEQVAKLLGNESFSKYMQLLTRLINDRNGAPKKPE